jgi:hypothetical protein
MISVSCFGLFRFLFRLVPEEKRHDRCALRSPVVVLTDFREQFVADRIQTKSVLDLSIQSPIGFPGALVCFPSGAVVQDELQGRGDYGAESSYSDGEMRVSIQPLIDCAQIENRY